MFMKGNSCGYTTRVVVHDRTDNGGSLDFGSCNNLVNWFYEWVHAHLTKIHFY